MRAMINQGNVAATASGRIETACAGEPRLLDRLREALRSRHYSHRTEESYRHWVKAIHEDAVINRWTGSKQLDTKGLTRLRQEIPRRVIRTGNQNFSSRLAPCHRRPLQVLWGSLPWRIGLCWQATRAPRQSSGMGDAVVVAAAPCS